MEKILPHYEQFNSLVDAVEAAKASGSPIANLEEIIDQLWQNLALVDRTKFLKYPTIKELVAQGRELEENGL